MGYQMQCLEAEIQPMSVINLHNPKIRDLSFKIILVKKKIIKKLQHGIFFSPDFEPFQDIFYKSEYRIASLFFFLNMQMAPRCLNVEC